MGLVAKLESRGRSLFDVVSPTLHIVPMTIRRGLLALLRHGNLPNLAIPVQTPHRDLAEGFLNHILDPQAGARISRFTTGGTPNKAARMLLPASERDNPAIYPPDETMARLWIARDLGEKTRLYDEIWTQVKAG